MSLDAPSQLAALGNDLRLNVFRFVIHAGTQGRSAGEIAKHFDVSSSTLSSHLKTLQQSGLFQSRREHQRIVYSVDQDHVRKLIQFLVSDCCGSNPKLCGLDFKE